MTAYTPVNILVTGGSGFIGSHLVKHLVEKYPQYRVINVDKLDYCSSNQNLQIVLNSKNYAFVRGDITSFDFVNYLVQEKKIDTIIHAAASTHVDNSFSDSFGFTQNNVLGTHVMLEVARLHGIQRFIHVSTDEVYGEAYENQPNCLEESILAPSNPYAATKAAAECMVKAYAKSFGIPAIITRSNNVYGPYQYPEKIIPKFICRLLKNQCCFVHGDGSNRRRYIHVDDVTRAFDIILHHGQTNEIYNIGTDFEISNLDLAKMLIRLFHLQEQEDQLIMKVTDRKFNDHRYAIDCTKLKEIGWNAEIDFESGLRSTIEWYRSNATNSWEDISCIDAPHSVLKRLTPIFK